MEDTPTISAVRAFLDLITAAASPSDAALLCALDTLAMAYHLCPEGEPSDRDDRAPRLGFAQLYKCLTARFQDFDAYSVADPLALDQPAMIGDPIDDLADISSDLGEVIWRFERFGADDAHWHFRFLYEIHWGRHLRELALYLHAKLVSQ